MMRKSDELVLKSMIERAGVLEDGVVIISLTPSLRKLIIADTKSSKQHLCNVIKRLRDDEDISGFGDTLYYKDGE